MLWVCSQKNDKVNTIHPNDDSIVIRKNDNVVFILTYTLGFKKFKHHLFYIFFTFWKNPWSKMWTFGSNLSCHTCVVVLVIKDPIYRGKSSTFILGQTSHTMPIKPSKWMQTCKPSFTLPNACMQRRWRWHGMAPIGCKSATKKFDNKKSTMSSISMDLRWFMHDMSFYPLILFSFFG